MSLDLHPTDIFFSEYQKMKNNINNPSIKGILFDVDGTLYYQTPLRLIMILNLFLSNFWRPKELKGLIKIISTYRWAQEQLRKNNISDGNNAQQQLILTVKKNWHLDRQGRKNHFGVV